MALSKHLIHLLCVGTILMMVGVKMEPAVRLKIVPLTKENVEEIYLQARKYNAKNYDQPEDIDRNIKKKIYKEIFACDILSYDRKPVNMDNPPSMYGMPVNVRQDLYDSMGHKFMGMVSRYTYRSKPQKVKISSLDKMVPENAFLCLGVSRAIEQLLIHTHAFYISDEYDVSLVPGRHIAGRFIFQPSGHELVLSHLAEEPATVLETSRQKLENLYSAVRNNTEPAKREEDDPVCKMGPIQRAQICSSVIYSSYFDDFEKDVFPNMIGVSHCSQADVSFEHNTSLNGVHREWMLWCPSFLVEKGPAKSYAISRGDKSGNVFVYVDVREFHPVTKSKYYLANVSTNVRNVTSGYISPSVPNEETGRSKEPASSSRANDSQATSERNPDDDVVPSTSSSVLSNDNDNVKGEE